MLDDDVERVADRRWLTDTTEFHCKIRPTHRVREVTSTAKLQLSPLMPVAFEDSMFMIGCRIAV